MGEHCSETAQVVSPRSPEPPPLTPLEVRVLRLLADGSPAVAAAEASHTTLSAVARATTSLRVRYGVSSTVEALDHARRAGLL